MVSIRRRNTALKLAEAEEERSPIELVQPEVDVKTLRQFIRGYGLEIGYRLRLEWSLRNVEYQRPILVYQMGKVGSSTVVRTLEQMNLNEPILQVHTLDSEHLEQAIAKQRASSSSYLPEHLIVSSILVRTLAKGPFPCRIITLTREPVSRAISFAFQDWQKKAPEARSPNGGLKVERMKETVDALLRSGGGHADPTRWFDRELKGVWGIDVFSIPYDWKQGYAILKGGEVSALVMRLEDLNRSLPSALAELLDVDPGQVTLARANEGDNKWYAESLRTVKETYQVSPALAQSIFDTRYFLHFYGGDREQARRRWTDTLRD